MSCGRCDNVPGAALCLRCTAEQHAAYVARGLVPSDHGISLAQLCEKVDMSEACSVCGVDPTTRSGWAAVASRTQVIDGKRYCYACVPVDDDELRRRLADHGISLAQLCEKVEALKKRANHDADKHNRLCDVVADQMHRLDAALKRIEELEATTRVQELSAQSMAALIKRITLLERDMGDVHPNALSGDKR